MQYFVSVDEHGLVVIIGLDGYTMTSFTENPENSDWIAYQAWVAEGNTPEPWPPTE